MNSQDLEKLVNMLARQADFSAEDMMSLINLPKILPTEGLTIADKDGKIAKRYAEEFNLIKVEDLPFSKAKEAIKTIKDSLHLHHIIVILDFDANWINIYRLKIKTSGCFIATAVYNSYLAPEVELLQRFRDDYLMDSIMGRIFIKTYYKCSPPIAKFISESIFFKSLVRRLLVHPIVKIVKICYK